MNISAALKESLVLQGVHAAADPSSDCAVSKREPAITFHDDLSRNVFGVLGVPLDALELDVLLARIDAAVASRKRFLLSTPNVNFLMMSRADRDFRESLLVSDSCPVDGMPMVWIARLLGVPIPRRLSGSDIFDALRARTLAGDPLKVFLFGGSDGIAHTVSRSINAEQGGMACVGALNPGFGSVADMSTDALVQTINSSRADLLTVFLSARKAQGWLVQNHERVEIPVRAQFGATINLQAGTIRRAPLWLQSAGFEWLWRVKEEPYLWRRYWSDGLGLLNVLLTSVLPLTIDHLWRSLIGADQQQILRIDRREEVDVVHLKLRGAAVARHIDVAIDCFKHALDARKPIVIDLSDVSTIDPRFFGLLLMLRKRTSGQDSALTFLVAKRRIKSIFRLNGFDFLLSPES